MKAISSFLIIFLSLFLCVSCEEDSEIYESPQIENEFTNFTFDTTIQKIGEEITITIEPGDYQAIEVNFVNEIGVAYTPPITEPSEGEDIGDLDNVIIPTITATENNNLEYKISATKLRPADIAFLDTETFLVEIKVINNDGIELTGYHRIYFKENEYVLDSEYVFIDDGANVVFNPTIYSEIEITLLNEDGTPVTEDTNVVSINKVNDTNYNIASTEPTEQLIEVKLSNDSGEELITNHLIHFYAHGTVDNYKTAEGIELGVDTTEELILIHGTPVEADKLISEDGLTERWQYLSDGIGFEVNIETQIVEKVYFYSTLYEDYSVDYPYVIQEDLRFKYGVLKAKHPPLRIDITPTNGTIKEPTLDENGESNTDGVYYFDFENIGRFIYISDSISNINTTLVVQVILE